MRIKLDLPQQFLHVTFKIPVRISDINYGNHTGNDAIVSIIHEARMQWLQQFNYTELDIEGVSLIMADLAIEFRNETFYGDVICVELAIGEISKKSFELYYRLTVERDEKVVLVAKAKTGMVCYNYQDKILIPIPSPFMKILINGSSQ